MDELICVKCGARQVLDSHPAPKCLDCGADARPATRCYGCHGVIPELAACPRCNLPTLPNDLYPVALMLRQVGVDLQNVPAQTKALSAKDLVELERHYPQPWKQVDEAMTQLADLISTRVNPTMGRLVLASLDKIRTAPDATPEAMLHAIRASHNQFASALPSLPPFPLAVCKAIHEAAPWKLAELQWRLKAGKPFRGIDETGKAGLAAHADALNASFGPEDARFAVGVAYQSILTYSHSLILGEVFSQNDRSQVLHLYKAAEMQESIIQGVPISLIRNVGVIYALGPRPTLSLKDPWVPQGFLFVPNRGPSLRLHEVEGLRSFLNMVHIPIQPQTLGGLLHLLLAPFPWEVRCAFEGENLVNLWVDLEAKIADWTTESQRASDAPGMKREPPQDRREQITLRLDSIGKRLIYRPPHLEVK